MTLPTRKHPRLKNYDYGQCGCYHITICTKNRIPILSKVIPAKTAAERPTLQLTPIGSVVERYISQIPTVYAGLQPLKYAIMPNHVHLLLFLETDAQADVTTVVRSLKRLVSKEVGKSIWQESFYDVVIRNDIMFQCEWAYIDQNPDKWAEDELFV